MFRPFDSITRLERQRRRDFILRRRKVILGIVFALLTIGLCLTLFYRSIQDAHWEEHEDAVQTAIRKTDMVESEWAKDYIAEKAYVVVRGQDEEGRRLFVWIGNKGELYEKYADEGVSAAAVKKNLRVEHPDIRILRVVPGVAPVEAKADTSAPAESSPEQEEEMQYIWEVFYDDLKENRYRYAIYDFETGDLLRTISLHKHG